MPASIRQLSSSVPRRLALFGAALMALFALGAAAGRLFEPAAPGADAAAEGMGGHGAEPPAGHGAAGGHGGSGHGVGGQAGGATPVRGLAVAANGLRLVLPQDRFPLGDTRSLRFRVVDSDGRPVRDYDTLHAKRMHLILVRRDLTGFQHLHPRLGADGAWAAPVRFEAAGSYRLFADFSHAGTATTLAADLAVDGDSAFRPLPAPSPTATSDGGYDVRLLGSPARAGAEAQLRFAVSRQGRPVAVEPYLGADGHLVALREGDLAFLHVHPQEGGTPPGEAGEHGHGGAGPVAFAATFPTAGSYRLFLQFKVNGRVETAAFTEEVE